MRIIKWLYPGMGIKRWISLSVMGVIFIGFGMVLIFEEPFLFHNYIAWFLIFVGGILCIFGMKRMIGRFISVFLPNKKELVNIVYSKYHLDKGPNIVAIGGGHGLSTLLQGVKRFSNNIKAIVTVADDGGSSGRLREQFDVLPPGDIRNCLVALADAEPLMRQLFQFRFSQGEGLKGHNFGNLFITALSEISGDFRKAIKHASKVLAVRGEVIPSTLERVRLIAEHENGDTTFGEENITKRGLSIKSLELSPKHCIANKEAIDAIKKSDVVLIGPGSLYTSIIPNLLAEGITNALIESKAVKIYICNVMTQHGETDAYTVSDHIKTIFRYINKEILDYCIVNTASIPEDLLSKYAEEKSIPVKVDVQKLADLNCKIVAEDIISNDNYVRHDPVKLTTCIEKIISKLDFVKKGRKNYQDVKNQKKISYKK